MSVPRRLFLLSVLGSLAACTTGIAGGVRLAPGSRLVVVRHADRSGSDLSALGRARAAALPDALADIPLDTIYSPGIQRNIDTAAPLARALDLPITRIPQERPAPTMAAQGAGKSVIWVGNKGNLKSIWEDFGFEGLPPLEYGELFIVTADARGEVSIERRHWGPV